MEKLTYEEVVKRFSDAGCKLLSTEYINNRQKMHYIAQCGHENIETFADFGQGHGRKCKECSCGHFYTIDELKNIFSNRNCQLLTTHFKNAFTKLEYIAACGHKNTTQLHTFLAGHGTRCRKCMWKKTTDNQRFKYEEVKKMFAEKDCKLITPFYIDAHQHLEYIASCGHRAKTQLYRFRTGSGITCPMCRKYLGEKRLGELLSKEFGGENVIPQYKIHKNGRVLYIDFFIPSKSLAFEYNGRQHYETSTRYHSNKLSLQNQKDRDFLKKQWCDENSINLIIVDGRKYETPRKIQDMVLPDYIIKTIGDVSTQP